MLATEQKKILSNTAFQFQNYLEKNSKKKQIENGKNSFLKASSLKILQVNIGRWCNQSCKHCHVNASPQRTEDMSFEIAEKCIKILSKNKDIETLDITGGAPEGSQVFRYLVQSGAELGKHIIDRCNLTILEEPGFEWLYDFLLQFRVEIVSSLPHFSEYNTDKQRGQGVFSKSITALKRLNDLGYGKNDNLKLNLVYNPSGLYLSSDQQELENEFKQQLFSKYHIEFNNLYCINNLPINRFLKSLVKKGKFEDYMSLLASSFNIATIDNLMCRQQLSVNYEGYLYDCDFNQMLDMKIKNISHINNFDFEKLINRDIEINNHCFGCTAGSGSSCGGSLV